MTKLCRSSVSKYIASFVCFSLFSTVSSYANVYSVNSLADTNAGVGLSGTLRYCINQANASGTASQIGFAVTGSIN